MSYNQAMYEFHPYITNDGSIGLYNSDFNDIYHSAKGALTEAYEKFIYPIDFNLLLAKDEIKVLDICYGIGYNSKAFLNIFFEKFLKNNSHAKMNIGTIYTNNVDKKNMTYSEQIYTNNINNNSSDNEANKYNAEVYSNNISYKISVTAIDNDKILAFLSPFIKTGILNYKNFKIDFEYNKINKYCDNKFDKNFTPKKINNIINYFLFDKIAQNYPEIFTNSELHHILMSNKYNQIFDNELKGLFKLYKNKSVNSSIKSDFISNLHNIYYRHISNKYKNRLKRYNLENVDFLLKCGDARKILSDDKQEYDIIFLDAFTPSKCPCLWSLEFFRLLFEHLNRDGIILTYTTSAAVRNSMINAGFFVGNIYNEREKKYTGTIAVKNKMLIKYPLSEFDFGLLNTKAGIFYRDENLTGQNEAINHLRKIEVENSKLMSSTEYKKLYKLTN